MVRVVRPSVCLSVCLSVTREYPPKLSEIDVFLLLMWNRNPGLPIQNLPSYSRSEIRFRHFRCFGAWTFAGRNKFGACVAAIVPSHRRRQLFITFFVAVINYFYSGCQTQRVLALYARWRGAMIQWCDALACPDRNNNVASLSVCENICTPPDSEMWTKCYLSFVIVCAQLSPA